MKSLSKYLVLGLLLLLYVGSVSAYLPAYDSNTKLLLHFNESLNSTVPIDQVGHIFASTAGYNTTNIANATKFGTGSGSFPGGTNYISSADSADWDFGANSFTIDFWANRTRAITGTDSDTYLCRYADANNYYYIYNDATGLIFSFHAGGGDRGTFNLPLINYKNQFPTNKWNHVAIVGDRTNGTFKLYFNGTDQVALVTTTALNGNLDIAAPLRIGYDPDNALRPYTGFLDEYRISPGVVRWSQGFTPPTGEYGKSSPPTADFTITTTPISLGGTLQFNDTTINFVNMWNWSINQSLTSKTWYNFSGVDSDAVNISYTPTAMGVYEVNLSVKDTTLFPAYLSNTTKYAWVNETLAANFNATPLWSKPNRSISFVDMSVGADMYNWTWNFGDEPNGTYPQPVPPPNTSYQRNPTKAGYQLLGKYNVNLTVKGADGQANLTRNAYIRITMNDTLSLQIRDASTYNLVVAPVTVEIVTGGSPYTNGTTSTGTVVFELPDGSYDLVVPAITGLYYGNIASVVMAGTDTSGIIYLTPVTTTTLQSYVPHQVRFILVDRYANKLPRVTVIVNATGTTLPLGANWFDTMFGVGSGTFPNITSANMTGITGTDGAIVFTMHGSVVYDINMNNVTQGISKVITLNPIQDEYTVWLMTTATAVAPSKSDYINATLFVFAPTTGTTYLNFSYDDHSLTTVNVTFIVNAPNYTVIYSNQFMGPSPYNQTINWSYAAANVAGDAYVWGFYANTTMFGNVSQFQGVTLKGPTGRLLDFDPCKGYAIGWGNEC